VSYALFYISRKYFAQLKGKSTRNYEFSSKILIVVTKTHGVIVAIKIFDRNLYDGNTLDDTI